MAVELMRIDDRLIHGQVVVGWGQPLDIGFLVLVDDEVAQSDWEQELYRMGVPPEMDLKFESVAGAARRMPTYRADPRTGMLLTGEVATMRKLVELVPDIRRVTVGGLHHRAGRTERLRYVFLAPEDEAELRALAAAGVTVSAQDVPSAHAVPLGELLGEDARS